MGVAVVRGLLLGGLAWILWDKLGALGLAALPTALLLLLFWNQESLLYVPRKGQYKQRPSGFKPLDNYEELTLVTMDGAKITAWFIKQHERHSDGRSAKNCPTVVFLHGNGGMMDDRLVNIRGLFTCTGCNILMVEYRGYGTSEGEPSEDGLKLDAQAALDYLHDKRDDVDKRQIFAFGRSLGGAVAIWLAHKNPHRLRGVMVENSFTSIRAMAMPIFPFLEIIPRSLLDFLLTSRWDSLSVVGELKIPVLFLAGEDDEVVPHEQMLELHRQHRDHVINNDALAAPPAKSTLVAFPGGRHNETWMLDDYYGHIVTWLDSFPELSAGKGGC